MMFNTFVHTFMYYYFGIALFGKTVWWKKVRRPLSRAPRLTAPNRVTIRQASPHVFCVSAPQWLTALQNMQFLSVLFLINIWMFYYSFDNVRRMCVKPFGWVAVCAALVPLLLRADARVTPYFPLLRQRCISVLYL